MNVRSKIQVIRGFTLVEMLVAMAVTLLMMAALARAFGFVGARVRDSRADVTLSSSLRDITTRLSEELKRCTVTLEPATYSKEPYGYFMYCEGPVTDATSSLFRAYDSAGNTELDDSRYGDFDDYLAFTAVAEGDNWFYGKVPRFILDQKAAELAGTLGTYGPAANAWDPIVIRSKYAEIIYFASPEYDAGTLPGTHDPTASPPRYVDADNNGFPDRLRIHRRVLLIRPDLNLQIGSLNQLTRPTVPPTPAPLALRADAWPTATAASTMAAATLADGWLYGMAHAHQHCDLSIRRVLASNGEPANTGGRALAIAANSLADLSKPHNRFAHVRVPDSVLGVQTGATSMPLLALGAPATILNMQTLTAPTRLAPPETPNVGPVVTPRILSGFVRPEFVLGNDLTHPYEAGWGRDRLGEDLVTNNAIGFDVQIYDPNASFFTTNQAAPTVTTAIPGLVVGPNDPGYREALLMKINELGRATPPNLEVSRGGFVDLAYPVLAGGSLRGWQSRRLDRRSDATVTITDNATISNTGGYLITPFSGVRAYDTTDNSFTSYQRSLYSSGRLLLDSTPGNQIRIFQPAFDTYTSFYERDGLRQQYLTPTFPWTAAPTTNTRGTVWTTATTNVDTGSDGLDTNAVFGADDASERETLPPFPTRPESIRITIRLENPSTRQIRQSSVVHRD